MSDADRLRALWQVSKVIRDSQLLTLQAAARACKESRARLASLAAPSDDTDLPLAAAALARLRYDRWAEARRAEINLLLAGQTADWLTARDAARKAFGHTEALEKLSARLAPNRH